MSIVDTNCDELEAEYDLNEDILNSNFKGDILDVAKQYMVQFFQDKPMYCGGCVPRHLLHNPKRISKVVNTTVSDGIDQAYAALEKTLDPQELKRAAQYGTVTGDIILVNETLKMLARHGVPKCFAGGMMLMYLEFCEGVQV